MWTRVLARIKLRAAVLHVGLSLLLFGPMLYLICRRWYPGPLFFTDGGWEGVRIMALIDLVLGPTLTFLVYNPAKTRLALGVDFSFIGLVQLGALVYGVLNVSSSSIGAVAFYDGEFKGINQIQFEKQKVAPADWAPLGEGPPYWVYARIPRPDEFPKMLELGMGDLHIPPEAQFYLYQPLQQHLGDMQESELKMDALAAADAGLAKDYASFTQRHADQAGHLHYYRMVGFYRVVVLVLDDQGGYVGFIGHEVPHPPPPPRKPRP